MEKIKITNLYKTLLVNPENNSFVTTGSITINSGNLRNCLNLTNLFNMVNNGRKTEVRRRKKTQSKITILWIFLIFALLMPVLSPVEVPIVPFEFIKIQF
jgi:hypothetical protein